MYLWWCSGRVFKVSSWSCCGNICLSASDFGNVTIVKIHINQDRTCADMLMSLVCHASCSGPHLLFASSSSQDPWVKCCISARYFFAYAGYKKFPYFYVILLLPYSIHRQFIKFETIKRRRLDTWSQSPRTDVNKSLVLIQTKDYRSMKPHTSYVVLKSARIEITYIGSH